MAEKLCTRCGMLNAVRANFCSSCGAQSFVEVSEEQLGGNSPNQVAVPGNNAVRLGTTRIVILSTVTSGAYIIYWLYMTWKQLQKETGEVHYPVLHALTMFVPVYGLFRLYKHVGVIQALALKAGVDTSLTPGLAVVLMVLSWSLVVISGNVESVGIAIMLGLIRLALLTTVIVWAQATLNRYWSSIKGEALENVPIGTGEVLFVVLVLFIQLFLNS